MPNRRPNGSRYGRRLGWDVNWWRSADEAASVRGEWAVASELARRSVAWDEESSEEAAWVC
jgi:hypothetical protein